MVDLKVSFCIETTFFPELLEDCSRFGIFVRKSLNFYGTTLLHNSDVSAARNYHERFKSNKNKCSRNSQHYAQICTTALFYILAPTCFDCSLPSSGSFWIRLIYIKIHIDLVVYHITDNRVNHDTPAHRPLNQHYMIYHQINLHFHVTQ
jgi:hypothetical protein